MSNKRIIYTSFKLFILAVCVTVVTYAWFAKEDKGGINSLTTNVEQVVQLEVSTDNGNSWSESGFSDITNGLIFEHEITGDGINLYVPALKDNLGIPNYFTRAIANEDYLDINFTFRSEPNILIYLEQASSAIPSVGTSDDQLCCSDNVANQSADGNFSKDLIAGAVRVAFIENDSEGNPQTSAKMVWAPNKNYELINTDGNYTAVLNSTNRQDYRCLDVLTPTTFNYKSVPNLIDTIQVSKSEKMTHGQPYIAITNQDGLASSTIRVWIEGNDRETIASLKGGKFKIHLSFLALKKNISSAPNVSIDGNSIIGADETMEYSINNGVNWTPYNNNITFNTNDIVMIRVRETSTIIESPIVTLNF